MTTGVVAFVTNGGFIDSQHRRRAAQVPRRGVRRHLRLQPARQPAHGIASNPVRRAARSSAPAAGHRRHHVLVKGTKEFAAAGRTLRYRDIGDYLSREDKLRIIGGQDLASVSWQEIKPNTEGDWINQRDERFTEYQAIGEKDRKLAAKAIFEVHSSGLKTGRDSWVYNFSKQRLTENVESMIDFYNEQVASFARHARTAGLAKPKADAAEAFIDYDPARFSWNRIDKSNIARGVTYTFNEEREHVAAYRPFTKQNVIFDARLNDMVYQLNRLFPTPRHTNIGFYMTGMGALNHSRF